MRKWLAASRSELEEVDATQRLEWAKEHEGLGVEDWLSWVWSDEMYVRRMAGASRGQTWVFRDRKSTRLNSSHQHRSRMPSSA